MEQIGLICQQMLSKYIMAVRLLYARTLYLYSKHRIKEQDKYLIYHFTVSSNITESKYSYSFRYISFNGNICIVCDLPMTMYSLILNVFLANAKASFCQLVKAIFVLLLSFVHLFILLMTRFFVDESV